MNQSYKEKKRGLPKRSETAPSAIGMDPIFPPLKKLVRRLLALSNKFICLVVLVSSVLVDDWHLHSVKSITTRQTPNDNIKFNRINHQLDSLRSRLPSTNQCFCGVIYFIFLTQCTISLIHLRSIWTILDNCYDAEGMNLGMKWMRG